jgi:hypothetical protein
MTGAPSREALQATLFDFALMELVRQHRSSFAPLWSAESWAKLLIWLALNCGCSGDETGLKAFADALGSGLSARMRRVFFTRELDDLELQVLADPAEPQVLVLPQGPEPELLETGRILQALERIALVAHVAAAETWQRRDAAVVVPWRPA